MQFSCYNCGLLFHDGPPPMEALSMGQAMAVGGADVDRSILAGTRYEDLSPYNFCAFCIHMIAEFPSVISHPEHVLTQHNCWVSCSCGYEYCKGRKARYGYEHVHFFPDNKRFWVWVNRAKWLHSAKIIYPNGDFALAEALLHKEV